MAYTELIKNFNRTRAYMRQFYVFGFKSRDEYSLKSARSYDDERRRMESWLGEYMRFARTPDGKNVFLSIDSRAVRRNPIYKAWMAKSFTDGDITLHFLLLDALAGEDAPLTLNEITQKIEAALAVFEEPRTFDESTIRKKLKEYADEGLIIQKKAGRSVCFELAEGIANIDPDIIDFFSEALPCGMLGAFLDKSPGETAFAFKHHVITFAMDDEIVCSLFLAMREKRMVTLEVARRGGETYTESRIVPIKILRGVQTGRQYLMAFIPRINRMIAFRIDSVLSVKAEEVCEDFEQLREDFKSMRRHLWGASTKNRSGIRMEHVEFTVRYEAWEPHIHRRLEREKRCGSVERLDDNHSRFAADVYDASELLPWIRTFICRITELSISDKVLETLFKEDIKEMYRLYELGGERE